MQRVADSSTGYERERALYEVEALQQEVGQKNACCVLLLLVLVIVAIAVVAVVAVVAAVVAAVVVSFC